MRAWLVRAVAAVAVAASSCTADAGELRRVQVPAYRATRPVTLDVGELIRSGAVQPREAITVDEPKDGCWLLRTPRGSEGLRWPRSLLCARAGAPDLVIDVRLEGVYDVYAMVRAVDFGGAPGIDAKPGEGLTMTFEVALDDGSQREIVGAKGFPDYHYDTEVLVGHGWQMAGRKLVLRDLGKPVYLYGFRLVPPARMGFQEKSETVTRWLATDHVTIAKVPDRHLAFPGVARLPNGDIVVVYREGTVHGVEAIGKISLSRSTDGGRTWLPRVTAVDRPGVDDRDPSLHQMSDGTLVLFFPDCLCTSNDFGKTWSPPLATPVFGPKGGVEDEEGNIIYGGLRRTIQAELTRVGGRSVRLQGNCVYRSRDKGRSWEPAGTAAYTAYLEGPRDFIWYDEPFMCVAADDWWIFTSRVDLDGLARIIRSPDHGKTWEPIITTPVWGYPQHLLPLADGRLLMSYGYRRPPYGVRACLSRAGGKTWDIQNEIVLRMDGGTPEGQPRKVADMDLGYPTSIQLDDGSIFTVYYMNTAGSNCFIAGTFWNLPP